ncbi:MAG: DUF6029 family protein [bacterium]
MALALTFAASRASAQEPSTLSFHALNQLEYSLNTDGDRATNVPQEILEEWLDLDVRYERVLLGFRYEAFQPHEKPRFLEQTADSVREGIVQRYAAFEFGGSGGGGANGGDKGSGGIRVGNFYEIFGKGLLFRSYEDRAIRIDGNMEGVQLWGSRGRLAAKAISGRMREVETDRRTDILHGADLEARVAPGLALGGSYLIRSARDPRVSPTPLEPRHVEALGGRASYNHSAFDLYAEAGRINRHFLSTVDLFSGRGYDDIRGKGYYASLSLYPPIDTGPLSALPIHGAALTAQLKNYDNFRFQPEGSGQTDYNNPPAATRENAYTLLSRHPHILDADDEQGFSVEANVNPTANSKLTLYRAETDRQGGDPYYHEWYAEWRTHLGDAYDLALVYDVIDNNQTGTEDKTPIVEVEYAPGGGWSLRGEYQYQDSDIAAVGDVPASEASTHLALLEYNISSDLTVSAVGERATAIEENFVYAQVDYHLSQEHFVSVTVGNRREGFVCVGGICRFEPAFEGVEARFITSF